MHTWRIGGLALPQPIQQVLLSDRYQLAIAGDWDQFAILIPQCDCLVFTAEQAPFYEQTKQAGWQIPIVFPVQSPAQLPQQIEQAIACFLRRHIHQIRHELANQLQDKLQARLGYLGVFYKRSPDYFLRNLPPKEKDEQIRLLTEIYRSIVLEYFQNNSRVNQKIDEFANLAFLGDVSMSQILEIHMNLMDEFSKQLKIERRSDDILVDYRITLIDVLAHLCEIYRRSIAKESH
ncbi:MAG: circadian clock protein KaiA [Pseudanabaenaceae cyanobacterium]